MEKVPAMLLGLLAVIVFAGIILFDKIGPEVENIENDVMTELHL